jgi:hypothetical protein
VPVPPVPCQDRPLPAVAAFQEVHRVLRKLALAAVVAGAVAAVRKRSAGRTEADLWHEATRGPQAVSTPTTH